MGNSSRFWVWRPKLCSSVLFFLKSISLIRDSCIMLYLHIHHTICTYCISQAALCDVQSVFTMALPITCMYDNLMHLPCLCSWERPHWVCNCRQRRAPLLPRYPHYQLQTPSTSHSEYYHSLDPQSSNHLFMHASHMKRLYLSLVWLERR